jgi:CheY-like chemotaxis protein
MTGAPVVFVVDDDPSVRSSLKFLLSTVGLQVESFDSADTFLHKKWPDVPSCLVLDVRLPGLSGLDFQRELAARNIRIPIVFLTGHGDIPMSFIWACGPPIDMKIRSSRRVYDQSCVDGKGRLHSGCGAASLGSADRNAVHQRQDPLQAKPSSRPGPFLTIPGLCLCHRAPCRWRPRGKRERPWEIARKVACTLPPIPLRV